jgi:hypothetical protein
LSILALVGGGTGSEAGIPMGSPGTGSDKHPQDSERKKRHGGCDVWIGQERHDEANGGNHNGRSHADPPGHGNTIDSLFLWPQGDTHTIRISLRTEEAAYAELDGIAS